jgi:dolichyl-phosphate-mannose--protein O-mannosyl transferase
MGCSGHPEALPNGTLVAGNLHTLLIRYQDLVWKHFSARVLGLIVVPFVVYSSFYWVHFKVLSHSGTGDSFMTPRFQESLAGNELLLKAHGT